jgi:alpha-D-ribose 1-methylphosphonate 5-triphosphate synthase subunit PhnH
VRALGLDTVHDTRATFRALCDAMSRPGTVQHVPGERGDHAVAATLVDHEVTVHTPDESLRAALAASGRLAAADPTDADVVHADGVPSWDVRDLDRGSLVEPSDGATVVYRVEQVSPKPGGGTTRLHLSGPGVPGTRAVSVGLPAEEIEAVADAQSTYPRGVDAILTAGNRVVALPRSVTLEVA